jgi:hypothetical protein
MGDLRVCRRFLLLRLIPRCGACFSLIRCPAGAPYHFDTSITPLMIKPFGFRPKVSI